MSSLSQAEHSILTANPDLPMTLRFEVSPPEIIDGLLAIKDLTEESESEDPNIVGQIYQGVLGGLAANGYPDIQVVRADPIVSAADNFDKLLFPADNLSRSATYTRYTDEDHVLRTHMSSLIPPTFEKIDQDTITNHTFVLPGLVYRRDVIDPRHLDAFHQIDLWTLQDDELMGSRVNRERLLSLARVVFDVACPGANMIVYEAEHPYTEEGIEVYAEVEGREIEVLEAGLAHPEVLSGAGIDPDRYSGLALGMGVERLVMARKNLPDIRLIRSTDPRVQNQMQDLSPFVEVSNQPAISRDISFLTKTGATEEDICESIRNAFGDEAELLEEVTVKDRTSFANLHEVARERLGATSVDEENIVVSITLRHPDRTLTKKDAGVIYNSAYPKIHEGTTEGYA